MPGWVRDVGMKMLPWALIALISGGVTLFIDNNNMKKDLAREIWRNDKQDVQLDRQEIKQGRTDESISDMRDTQSEFQKEALHRLEALLKKEGHRR